LAQGPETGWRAARKAGQAGRHVNTTRNKVILDAQHQQVPKSVSATKSNEETQRGLTAKLPWGAGMSKQSAAVKRDLSGQAMLIKGKRGNSKKTRKTD